MKAAVYYENGAPGVLKYEELPDPAVRPGGIIIDVRAIGIQGGDTLNRSRGALVTVPTSSATRLPGSCAKSAKA